MKKIIITLVILFTAFALLWCVFNYNNIEVIEEGVVLHPVYLEAIYDSDVDVYISVEDSTYGYRNVDCNICAVNPYPFREEESYHSYSFVNTDGDLYEWKLQSHDFYYFIEKDGRLYREAADIEYKLHNISLKFAEKDADGAPQMPSFPNYSDYRSNAENVLDEIIAFFRWFGDCFLFLFRLVKFLFEWVIYYLEYFKIFFKELIT